MEEKIKMDIEWFRQDGNAFNGKFSVNGKFS